MRLDAQRLEAICEAIANKTVLLTAAQPDTPRYQALESRRAQIGGMLELARRLEDHRLVRFLETHKDALSRLIEAD